MARNNELKEINIKNRTCYYFDNIINIDNLDLDNILFITPNIKLHMVKNLYILFLITQIDISKNMIATNILLDI